MKIRSKHSLGLLSSLVSLVSVVILSVCCQLCHLSSLVTVVIKKNHLNLSKNHLNPWCLLSFAILSVCCHQKTTSIHSVCCHQKTIKGPPFSFFSHYSTTLFKKFKLQTSPPVPQASNVSIPLPPISFHISPPHSIFEPRRPSSSASQAQPH